MSVAPIEEKTRSTDCQEADRENVPDLFEYQEPKKSAGRFCNI